MTAPLFSRHLQSLFQRSTSLPHLLQIHSHLLKTALDRDPHFIADFISSACVFSMDFACSIFDPLSTFLPLFTWNSMINGYAKSPYPSEGIKLFSNLRRTGIGTNLFTYSFVLKACARSTMLVEGEMVHCLVMKAGFASNRSVGNILLHLYAICGEIYFARQVFDGMCDRDVITWSSIVSGYVYCDLPLNALDVFRQMKASNVEPNSITLVSLLSACTQMGSLIIGASIHSHITINNIKLGVSLGTALLEMYARCGTIDKALQVFHFMSIRNLQTWTVMISGLARHGCGRDALSLFSQMELSGLKPDSVVFCSILSACSHLGLVYEGEWYFDRMVYLYNIVPRMEHYGCMVDLFGRAGLVEDAYKMIKNMPMKPNSVILRSFIGSCKSHGNVFNVDESLMKMLLEIEPDIGANYVLAANISASLNRWEDVAQLRGTMTKKDVRKVPGCSWVEMDGGRGDTIK